MKKTKLKQRVETLTECIKSLEKNEINKRKRNRYY